MTEFALVLLTTLPFFIYAHLTWRAILEVAKALKDQKNND